MTMQLIGLGVGRTGTLSLQTAIEQLGLGPCHHMDYVLNNMDDQVPLWNAAISGEPDWSAIFKGFQSAVDWPTAGFANELYAQYPGAKFLLSHRSPESWANSYGETIQKLLSDRDSAPPHMKDWLDMAASLGRKTGFTDDLGREELMQRFVAHNDAVRALIPPDQLLVFQVKEGWGPLCNFLDLPVPDGPFPRTNDRAGFWELVNVGA
jgi:hypothetical protein